MKGQLTQRQRDAFDFVCRYIERNSMPPTIREIGEAMGGITPNGVMYHITALIKKGWLKQSQKGWSRSYVPALKAPGIPLVSLRDISPRGDFY